MLLTSSAFYFICNFFLRIFSSISLNTTSLRFIYKKQQFLLRFESQKFTTHIYIFFTEIGDGRHCHNVNLQCCQPSVRNIIVALGNVVKFKIMEALNLNLRYTRQQATSITVIF